MLGIIVTTFTDEQGPNVHYNSTNGTINDTQAQFLAINAYTALLSGAHLLTDEKGPGFIRGILSIQHSDYFAIGFDILLEGNPDALDSRIRLTVPALVYIILNRDDVTILYPAMNHFEQFLRFKFLKIKSISHLTVEWLDKLKESINVEFFRISNTEGGLWAKLSLLEKIENSFSFGKEMEDIICNCGRSCNPSLTACPRCGTNLGKTCKKCGETYAPIWVQCPRCLLGLDTKTKTCFQCLTHLPQTANFCLECGERQIRLEDHPGIQLIVKKAPIASGEVCYLDKATRTALNIAEWAKVVIVGPRGKIILKARSTTREDIGQNRIRLDAFARRRIGVEEDDMVLVRPMMSLN